MVPELNRAIIALAPPHTVNDRAPGTWREVKAASTVHIEVLPKDVAQIIRATFPGYKRRKVYIRAAESVTLTELNWSGGTRSSYHACTLDGQPLGNLDRFHAMAPWDARQIEGQSLPTCPCRRMCRTAAYIRNAWQGMISPGACVPRGGTFCGKDSILCIYVHPSDFPRYLTTGVGHHAS